jgi:hypothetical protein
MDNKTRCQSCGMPLGDDPAQWGTEADTTPVSEYCKFCYQDGAFTDPDQTLEGMVQSSVDFMTSNLGFDRAQAEKMSNDVIPGLRRWN